MVERGQHGPQPHSGAFERRVFNGAAFLARPIDHRHYPHTVQERHAEEGDEANAAMKPTRR